MLTPLTKVALLMSHEILASPSKQEEQVALANEIKKPSFAGEGSKPFYTSDMKHTEAKTTKYIRANGSLTLN